MRVSPLGRFHALIEMTTWVEYMPISDRAIYAECMTLARSCPTCDHIARSPRLVPHFFSVGDKEFTYSD